MFQFESKGRKKLLSQLKAVRQEKFPLICKRWVIFFSPLFRSLLIGWNLLTLETATYFTQMPFWCLAIIQPVAYLLKTCYKYKYISSSNIHFKIGHKGNKKMFFKYSEKLCLYVFAVCNQYAVVLKPFNSKTSAKPP